MEKSNVLANAVVLLALSMGACGGTKIVGGGNGGTGGATATGGASGGKGGTGGATATGGASGGKGGTGGASATGGAGGGGTGGTGGTAGASGAGGGGGRTGGASATGGAGGGGATAGAGGSAGAGGAAGAGGCPPDGLTLNAGCATRTIAETIASPADNALLSCQTVGTCLRWRVAVNCGDQSLTAGTISGHPACVCRPSGAAPGAPMTLYVDPDPPPAIFMEGATTGALQPPACRYRTLTQALSVTTNAPGGTFNRVVMIHETSSNVHLTAETFPIEVPPGVELTNAEYGGFGPTPPTIDLTGGPTPRVVLGNGASVLGFTLNGSATNNALGGTVPGTVMLATSTASSGGTANLRQVSVLGIPGSSHTGFLVRGSATVTADWMSIRDMNIGIDVRLTDATVGAMATFTGTGIAISSTSPLAIGARVGPAGSFLNLSGGSSIKVPGTAVVMEDGGQAVLTNVAIVPP